MLVLSGVLLGGTPQPDFWQSIVDPGYRQAQLALKRGTQLFDRAEQAATDQQQRPLLEAALTAFKQATAASPRNADGWYWTGRALNDLDHAPAAVDAYLRARQLHIDATLAFSVAFELSIAYTKIGAYEKALVEYDRAERSLGSFEESRTRTLARQALIHGNAAELLMALGRLDEAIQRYKEAVLVDPQYILARYGLAVAYDRDEQVSKAAQEMQKVLAADPKLAELTRPSVFFIPEGDIHYYFALSHQALGNNEEARKAWELFLQRLPQSPWAGRALAHLAQLGRPSAVKLPPAGRPLLAPRPGLAQQEASAAERRAVQAQIRRYQYKLRDCYRKELQASPALAGRVQLALTVNREGRAEHVRVLKSTLRRPALQQCLVQAIRSIAFRSQSSGQPLTVEYTLEFKP